MKVEIAAAMGFKVLIDDVGGEHQIPFFDISHVELPSHISQDLTVYRKSEPGKKFVYKVDADAVATLVDLVKKGELSTTPPT